MGALREKHKNVLLSESTMQIYKDTIFWKITQNSGVFFIWKVLGSDVDKLSKFRSKHRMQRKILNRIFKTLSHQEQIILSSSMYEKTYWQGFLEGVLEAIQVSSL